MPFITSVERIGMEKGRKEGLEEGLVLGLHEAIAVALEMRLGSEGRALRSEAVKIKDAKRLRLLLRRIHSSSKTSEVRRWLDKPEK